MSFNERHLAIKGWEIPAYCALIAHSNKIGGGPMSTSNYYLILYPSLISLPSTPSNLTHQIPNKAQMLAESHSQRKYKTETKVKTKTKKNNEKNSKSQ